MNLKLPGLAQKALQIGVLAHGDGAASASADWTSATAPSDRSSSAWPGGQVISPGRRPALHVVAGSASSETQARRRPQRRAGEAHAVQRPLVVDEALVPVSTSP
jgi:hypothetical protein